MSDGNNVAFQKSEMSKNCMYHIPTIEIRLPARGFEFFSQPLGRNAKILLKLSPKPSKYVHKN